MVKEINITMHNKLLLEKRDMTVYHHATRSAHMISCNSSITLPLLTVMEDDYLHISIVRGPGRLEGVCIVSLPSWVDFEISSADDVAVAHSGDRTWLKIPPGEPVWQLKLTRSFSSITDQPSGFITVGDNNLEYPC